MFNFGGEYLNQRFEKQFQPDDDGFLYRYQGMGPAVRVSPDERDRFVQAYAAGSRRYIPAVFVSWIIVLVAFAFADALLQIDDAWLIAALLVSWPFLMLMGWRLRDAPRRALKGRPFVGDIPSKAELRREKLARVTWQYLGIGFAVSMYLLLSTVLTGKLEKASDLIWLGLAMALGAFIIVQALRKLWHGRPPR